MISESDLLVRVRKEMQYWKRRLPYSPYIDGILEGLKSASIIIRAMPKRSYHELVGLGEVWSKKRKEKRGPVKSGSFSRKKRLIP